MKNLFSLFLFCAHVVMSAIYLILSDLVEFDMYELYYGIEGVFFSSVCFFTPKSKIEKQVRASHGVFILARMLLYFVQFNYCRNEVEVNYTYMWCLLLLSVVTVMYFLLIFKKYYL